MPGCHWACHHQSGNLLMPQSHMARKTTQSVYMAKSEIARKGFSLLVQKSYEQTTEYLFVCVKPRPSSIGVSMQHTSKKGPMLAFLMVLLAMMTTTMMMSQDT